MTNVYSPPKASLELSASGTVFKKPKAVWLVQIVGFPLFITFCFGMYRNLRFALQDKPLIFMGMSSIVRSAVMFAAATLVALTLLAIYKHAGISRILGTLLIHLLWLPLITVAIMNSPPYTGYPELFGRYLAAAVIAAPFIYWAYAFALTERARGYFGTPKKPRSRIV